MRHQGISRCGEAFVLFLVYDHIRFVGPAQQWRAVVSLSGDSSLNYAEKCDGDRRLHDGSTPTLCLGSLWV